MRERFLTRWSRLKSEGGAALPAAAEVAVPAPWLATPAAAHASPTPVLANPVHASPTPVLANPVHASPAPVPSNPAPVLAAPTPARTALPTLEDAARLGADSDYSGYMARGVEQSVRRLALKKLFADPHFNIVDGLDIYMGDYNKADPMPAAMLAALHAARDFLVDDAEPDAEQDIEHDESTKGPE